MLTDFEITKRKLFLFNQAFWQALAEGKIMEAMRESARMAKLLAGEESLRKTVMIRDGGSSPGKEGCPQSSN